MDYHESRKEKKQKMSKKLWGSNILNCVGDNIAKYLNHCLTVKDEFMFKHGHIRQIFINKDPNKMQHFNNNRPISISSVMYRTIENIIMMNMEKEERIKNQIKPININQIGFN